MKLINCVPFIPVVFLITATSVNQIYDPFPPAAIVLIGMFMIVYLALVSYWQYIVSPDDDDES